MKHCDFGSFYPVKKNADPFRANQSHQTTEFSPSATGLFCWRPFWLETTGRTVLKANNMWRFPEMGMPQNGWFVMENPKNQVDDLGLSPFYENPV